MRDVRITEDVFPGFKGKNENFAKRGYRPTGWLGIVNACKLVRSRENVAVIFPYNSRMRDNRHMFTLSKYGGWGHDRFNKRFFHALVANGWAVPESGADTEPPTRPMDLLAENLWQEGVTLSWKHAEDNLAVRGYEIFADGQKVPWLPTLPNDVCVVTSALPRFPVSGLKADTEYELKVRTVDYANNRSEFSEPVTIRTAEERKPAPLPLYLNLGGPAAGCGCPRTFPRIGGPSVGSRSARTRTAPRSGWRSATRCATTMPRLPP